MYLHINNFVYEQVLTITFDGATANRRFLKLLHGLREGSLQSHQ